MVDVIRRRQQARFRAAFAKIERGSALLAEAAEDLNEFIALAADADSARAAVADELVRRFGRGAAPRTLPAAGGKSGLHLSTGAAFHD